MGRAGPRPSSGRRRGRGTTQALGTVGFSQDGCISLRTAALAPEPLKAVAAARSTDGHYDNDGRCGGGSALTVDTRAWTTALPAAGSANPPPSSDVTGFTYDRHA
ncbi:CocE/NonD family hydrolase [Streptomyces sp. NPDC058683]|uniref:CocE/NonD family hydrolase n=1 Tax=Streptomyces sp. NPDC058683 TaxID=3346597 RepID=UPI003657B734